jgi:hypothetical protein
VLLELAKQFTEFHLKLYEYNDFGRHPKAIALMSYVITRCRPRELLQQ